MEFKDVIKGWYPGVAGMGYGDDMLADGYTVYRDRKPFIGIVADGWSNIYGSWVRNDWTKECSCYVRDFRRGTVRKVALKKPEDALAILKWCKNRELSDRLDSYRKHGYPMRMILREPEPEEF